MTSEAATTCHRYASVYTRVAMAWPRERLSVLLLSRPTPWILWPFAQVGLSTVVFRGERGKTFSITVLEM